MRAFILSLCLVCVSVCGCEVKPVAAGADSVAAPVKYFVILTKIPGGDVSFEDDKVLVDVSDIKLWSHYRYPDSAPGTVIPSTDYGSVLTVQRGDDESIDLYHFQDPRSLATALSDEANYSVLGSSFLYDIY